MQVFGDIIFPVHMILVDTNGDIFLKDTDDKYTLKVVLSADFNKTWSTLVSAIDTDPLKSKLLNNKNNLEYLDARFGNKVFYKFTNDKKTDIIAKSKNTFYEATTTATSTIR